MGLLNLFTKSSGDKYALYNSVGRSVNYRHDKLGYLSLHEKTLYVNKAVEKRGEKVGETKWSLFRKDNEIESHELLNLLDRPHPNMPGHIFWKLATMYRDVTGECWIRKHTNGTVFRENGKISKLEILNPSRVIKNFNTRQDEIVSITYSYLGGETETIPFEQLIYWNRPSLINHLEGESMLMSGLRSIMTENSLLELQNKISSNGGKLDGVFRFKDPDLTKEQIKSLKESFKESLKEAKEDTDNILFVGGGGEYQNTALNPVELGYLESRKLFADDMVTLTGVPRALVGVTTGETYANADVALRVFLGETIRPLAQELTNLLNWHLIPDEYNLQFIDPTPENVDNKIKVVEAAERSNTLTINERREIIGYEPATDTEADKIYVPFTKMPLGAEPTTPEQPEEKQVKKKMSHPLRVESTRRAYNENYKKSLKGNREKMLRVTRKYFDDQQKRMIENLGVRKSIRKKELFGEVFNRNLEIDLAKATFLPVVKEIVLNAGEETVRIFEGTPFNYTSALESAISSRVDFFAEQINNTVADQLQDTFTEWHANEETLNDLVERIQEDYGGIKEVNARRIANTESHIFMQTAKQDAYKQMQFAVKIWTWAPGLKGGVRDDHAAMDGEEVPLDNVFSNGMRYPGDPSFGAGEIVNCECSI